MQLRKSGTYCLPAFVRPFGWCRKVSDEKVSEVSVVQNIMTLESLYYFSFDLFLIILTDIRCYCILGIGTVQFP